ncbi:MAG: L,D-transpeptidase [Elainella sp.]
MALSKDGLDRYPVRRQSYSALSSSFMFLCFVTAALLIAVQSLAGFSQRSANQQSANQTNPEQSANQQSATQFANRSELANTPQIRPANSSQLPSLIITSQIASQPATAPPSAQDVAAVPVLRPGLAEILSASLQPVAVVYQPRLVVSLSTRQVTLYQNDLPQISYPIAVGREGWETPTGSFQILNLRENPAWRNPITGEVVAEPADNPLGSRWIGFWSDGKHQIGFHGTNQDELIGQAVSHGCIRMRDADIQALFTQVAVGTPVIVEP